MSPDSQIDVAVHCTAEQQQPRGFSVAVQTELLLWCREQKLPEELSRTRGA